MKHAKRYGQFFTPSAVAQTLVRWAVSDPRDRVLDPACGDGEFLACHVNSLGIELDPVHGASARQRAAGATVHDADFFAWALSTDERFDAAIGNPPFIRYQGFAGESRSRALRVSARIGASLPQLTSSWAPFIAGAASLLREGGRLAFVVPAEIGHATYAVPLLKALSATFQTVRIIAIREKIFPELSEDTWLLFADGFGGTTAEIEFVIRDRFEPTPHPPLPDRRVPIAAWEESRGHLRRWLLPEQALSLYASLEKSAGTFRLGSVADVGIGYVTGANDFFHLRPSEARELGIPSKLLRASVRKGDWLPERQVLTKNHVQEWVRADEPLLLLHLTGKGGFPRSVSTYLDSPEAIEAQKAYKCRVRDPWFAVPDVHVPDGFLTYMSGQRVGLIRNDAGCVGTNSVHVVNLKNGLSFVALQRVWDNPLTILSCELEGHPLGGGMLKVEPREAQRILLPRRGSVVDAQQERTLLDAISRMRHWRHYDISDLC